MSYLAGKASVFLLASTTSPSSTISAGLVVNMTRQASAFGSSSCFIASTSGSLALANLRTSASSENAAYWNFDPVQTLAANCSGSELRLGSGASAAGSEIAAAIAGSSYVPHITVGTGASLSGSVLTESFVALI